MSLVLSLISVIGSKSFILENENDSKRIFRATCSVLSVMLRNWKQPLAPAAPAVTSIIRGLLHSFRSPSNAYTAALIRQSRSADHNASSISKMEECALQHQHPDTVRLSDPFSVFTMYAPLDLESSESLSDVLRSFSQKSGLGVFTTQDGGADIGMSISETTLKPYAKHLIFVIAEYIAIQTSNRAILPGPVQDKIVDGIYHLLDICGSDREREFLLSALGRGNARSGLSGSLGHLSGARSQSFGSSSTGGRDAARSLFKAIWTDYKQLHHFKG